MSKMFFFRIFPLPLPSFRQRAFRDGRENERRKHSKARNKSEHYLQWRFPRPGFALDLTAARGHDDDPGATARLTIPTKKTFLPCRVLVLASSRRLPEFNELVLMPNNIGFGIIEKAMNNKSIGFSLSRGLFAHLIKSDWWTRFLCKIQFLIPLRISIDGKLNFY